jgi:aspartate aminotransferase
MQLSSMAENLIGSEIIKLAGEINQKLAQGQQIYNFTIGDFDPKIFPIPTQLTELIQTAYAQGHTNYPPATGIADLRQAVSGWVKTQQNLNYSADEILIAGGARPLIYAIYRTILDNDDKVIFPVPSWNNNHYCHLSAAQQICVETTAESNFMPTLELLQPHLSQANLLALCSPLNPTGTLFAKDELQRISEAVLAENKKRGDAQKPLYIMYDQIYSALLFNGLEHYDPVSLCPELRPYVIFVDGLSKAFAATGVRVGWTFADKRIIAKMQSILGHIGAWSPKAEQVATAQYLQQTENINNFLIEFKANIFQRLDTIYKGFQNLKNQGFAVDAIQPQAAIYLTIYINIKGKTCPNGDVIHNTAQATAYLLDKAGLAIVPFSAFGADANSCWYRLSVGTCKILDIAAMFTKLQIALLALK